jgi:hypothetical protein
VLTFGKAAFDALIKIGSHGVISTFDTGRPNGRANFSCYATDSEVFGQSFRVVCLPNFSKFKIDAQAPTIVWLKEAVSESTLA